MNYRGAVITPLHDPQGAALLYFEKCADSVLSQEDTDFTWVISIQEAHEDYTKLLRKIGLNQQVIIRKARSVRDLRSHLYECLIDFREFDWIHILCQDDRYTFSNSLFMIAKTLEAVDFISVKPLRAHGCELEPHEPKSGKSNIALNQVRARLEPMGINRIGGLSTIAFRSTRWRELNFSHNLLIDLELRRQLRSPNSLLPVLSGGLVTEVVWPGQSQFSLRSSSKSEFQSWVDSSKSGRLESSRRVLVADFYGFRELGDAWERSAFSGMGPIRFAASGLGRIRK